MKAFKVIKACCFMLLASAERCRNRWLHISGGISDAGSGMSTVLQSTESNDAKPPVATNNKDQVSILAQTYKNKFVQCSVPLIPNCKVFLCGTLHVTKNSADFVKEVIQRLQPDYVIIELCEARIDSLCESVEDMQNITFASVAKSSWSERSFKTLWMGLLVWMQTKAANLLGTKLGGELATAAREAHLNGATLILGDRLYNVTIQRALDQLTSIEKLKVACMLVWEILTMSIFRLKDYVYKSENDDDFVKSEIESFAKYLPALSEVIIRERDEYLSQVVSELLRLVYGYRPGLPQREGKVVVVVGAGHLTGMQECLKRGMSSEERMQVISSSSKHNSTWPGTGYLQVVDTKLLFPLLTPNKKKSII